MELAVVVPAHNAVENLTLCLRAIASSDRKPDQLIVADDGSSDSQVKALAEQFQATYIAVPNGPAGPARARNLGVEQTSADIVVFIDSDVVVHPNTFALIEKKFTDNTEVDALFGSYDDDPAVKTVVSRYKNLLHHFVHQNGHAEATTFWAGCGAVRRSAYLAVNGFDDSFSRPSIEDIDLGLRLSDAGYRIRLYPDIQVQHLKHWTLAGMVKTDIFSRAVPWTRLMAQRGQGIKNDLNTKMVHRISALVVLLLLVTATLMLFGYKMQFVFLGLLLVYLLLDGKLFAFLYRTGGLSLAAGGAALHFIYYLYSSITFVLVSARNRFVKPSS